MVNNDFEDVLMRRMVPPARSNLAERIIAAAPVKPQTSYRGWKGWIEDIAELFVLPKPAYALATVLLIGVLAGWSAMPSRDDTQDSISSYLYMNEVLNMGEWLS